MQLSPSYLHFYPEPCSLFFGGGNHRGALSDCRRLFHVRCRAALFTLAPRLPSGEIFVPAQCHNNLISSHLSGEISFFISLSEMQNKVLGMTHFAAMCTRFLKAHLSASKSLPQSAPARRIWPNTISFLFNWFPVLF